MGNVRLILMLSGLASAVNFISCIGLRYPDSDTDIKSKCHLFSNYKVVMILVGLSIISCDSAS